MLSTPSTAPPAGPLSAATGQTNQPASAAWADGPADTTPRAPKRRQRVLVVDDAPDVTEMLALLLAHAGYEVATAYSGTQALARARAEQFDLVVSDIGMPGMSGYELAAAVRGLPNYAAVPLVAVTGFTMYDDRDRALAAGFNAFLSKPISPGELINLVASL